MPVQMLPQGFSYACFVSFGQRDRDNDGVEFRHFLDRLHAQLVANAHSNQKGETYYLLNEHANAGNFRDTLQGAAAQCVCLLSIYSPNYWASQECAQERSFFIDRNLPRRLGPRIPRGIDCFAIPWRHLPVDNRGNGAEKVIPDDAPGHVRELSYFRQELLCPLIYREGLCSVIERDDDAARNEVDKYIRLLANEISIVIETFRSGLTPRRPMRRGQLYVLAAGPVAIADKLIELSGESEARRRSELYTLGGGPDWHPFTPGNHDHSIGRIVGNVVKNEMKDEIVELLTASEPTRNLRRVIQDAATRQEYAIVVVDPWSIHYFEHMRALLDGLDGDDYRYRNLLLVIVRDPSIESPDDTTSLNKTIETTFQEFVTEADWYFMNSITTEDEFISQLKSKFVMLRTRMQASRARSVDSSGPRTPVTL